MQKGLVYITRKVRFNAAHKLWNPSWDEAKNFEVFGKCANPNFHGHNFDLFVTLKGIPSDETGFVYNLSDLKILLEEAILVHLDHKNLNLDVPFMQGKLSSIENLIVEIWNILAAKLPEKTKLHKLKLYETENNYVEYFGE
ncbi:MAG: Uncharacterised protein [Bacteroidetes bacterium MED-G17]|nr:MAG: Uncharacterised protein [Bacteroidetes bacterium MED-G17]|tara:strand:- start:15749 stop:16171 length:423 start_codon:yes stop_codon:yes gene_type:complete